MALGRRPLLLLTLSLGLAGAQKSPEDVPVQPGFDARKVTVGLCLGHGRGCKCPMKVTPGAGKQGWGQDTEGEAGEGLLSAQAGLAEHGWCCCWDDGRGLSWGEEGLRPLLLRLTPLRWAGGGELGPSPSWTRLARREARVDRGAGAGGAEGSGGEGDGAARTGRGGRTKSLTGTCTRRQWPLVPQPPPTVLPVQPGPKTTPSSPRPWSWAPRAKPGRSGRHAAHDPHAPRAWTPQVEGRWLTIQLAASRAHLVSPADPLRLALRSIWTQGQDVELVLFGM